MNIAGIFNLKKNGGGERERERADVNQHQVLKVLYNLKKKTVGGGVTRNEGIVLLRKMGVLGRR